MAITSGKPERGMMLVAFARHMPSESDDIQYLLPIYDVNAGFQELREVFFLSPPGLAWAFHVDDEPLDKVENFVIIQSGKLH